MASQSRSSALDRHHVEPKCERDRDLAVVERGVAHGRWQPVGSCEVDGVDEPQRVVGQEVGGSIEALVVDRYDGEAQPVVAQRSDHICPRRRILDQPAEEGQALRQCHGRRAPVGVAGHRVEHDSPGRMVEVSSEHSRAVEGECHRWISAATDLAEDAVQARAHLQRDLHGALRRVAPAGKYEQPPRRQFLQGLVAGGRFERSELSHRPAGDGDHDSFAGAGSANRGCRRVAQLADAQAVHRLATVVAWYRPVVVSEPVTATDYFSKDHPLRGWATGRAVAARRRMFARFAELVPFDHDTTVVDVGVTPDEDLADSNLFEALYPYPHRITATSIEDASHLEQRRPGVTFVRTDGDSLPFADRAFDVAVSWAVVEHVGDREAQRQFVSELVRVSRRFFLTTPNRWFPLELHTFLPFAHWLPRSYHQRILRGVGRDFWAHTENLALLSADDLGGLFPSGVDVHIARHRTLGWTSNLLAHGYSSSA
jgi:SAM-dependent methyltransferase